ncbi:hypothetical protein STXM2123_5148 [Streptomyces sp. F-3]|nr:hypothetical protein STXM2123_5148 [Streptomyces sp. F-3]
MRVFMGVPHTIPLSSVLGSSVLCCPGPWSFRSSAGSACARPRRERAHRPAAGHGRLVMGTDAGRG